jgi:hypothetical protein
MSSGFNLLDYSSSSSSEEEEEEHTFQKPSFWEIAYENERDEVEYEPIFDINETTEFCPSFELPQAIDPIPEAMQELFLPDHMYD